MKLEMCIMHGNGEDGDPMGHGIPMGMRIRSGMGWEWE